MLSDAHQKVKAARIDLPTGEWYTYKVFEAFMANEGHTRESIANAWESQCVVPEVRRDARDDQPKTFYDVYKATRPQDNRGLAALRREWEDRSKFLREDLPRQQPPHINKVDHLALVEASTGATGSCGGGAAVGNP